jgi:hypothetical protein
MLKKKYITNDKPQICLNYVHGTCRYGSKCRHFHPKEIKFCKNYFSDGYCKYGDRCHFSHLFRVVLPIPVPCFRTEQTFGYEKEPKPRWITTYYTKDGIYFDCKKEDIECRKPRESMFSDYNSSSAKEYFRKNPTSNPFLLALRMVEEYKRFYMLFIIIQNMELLPELRNIVIQLLLDICDTKYFNNFEPHVQRFRSCGN